MELGTAACVCFFCTLSADHAAGYGCSRLPRLCMTIHSRGGVNTGFAVLCCAVLHVGGCGRDFG
eukprot:1145843-Pelagomonas_calceolata.AAC.1